MTEPVPHPGIDEREHLVICVGDAVNGRKALEKPEVKRSGVGVRIGPATLDVNAYAGGRVQAKVLLALDFLQALSDERTSFMRAFRSTTNSGDRIQEPR